ncbi:MAG: 16S rRNA (uracil(1498)-N(3))-methyltransferase [Rhodoferax sp.]|nr:16S rRNA (uracil(1498)-N(3))-methyltransferase [Rhodoferax sp.]
MPRFYCAAALVSDQTLELPPGAARHVQVLRLQPGDSITLFDGQSADEFDATILRMGRSDVQVQVGQRHTVAREPARPIHLAVGMPANDRMDWLVEKATELGVGSIQPLITERSVLKLSGERADKKVAHWQSVAVAACEQCGGNLVPQVQPVHTLAQWLKGPVAQSDANQRLLLSLRGGSAALASFRAYAAPVWFLSGPEGGLSKHEEEAAMAAGFSPASLGLRVLRAETAALAALTLLAHL